MNKAEATAKVLALVVRLHRDGQQPWPTRRQVSELTGVPLPVLDAVMTQLVADRRITVWTATVSGNMRKHEPTASQRFIQPSDEDLEAAGD